MNRRRPWGRGVAGAFFAVLMLLLTACEPASPRDFTDRTNVSFTGPDGTTSRYHLFAADLPSDEPLGLVVYFHGDGATEFEDPDSPDCLGGPDGVVAVARARGYLTVVIRTPDTDTLTWWESGAANTAYVAALLEMLGDRYRIRTDDMWLVGYSGGAQFITQYFLPLHSHSFAGGGAVMFGGGGRPYSVDERDYAEKLRTNFAMHWYTGADDDGTTEPDGYDALGDPVHGARAGLAHYTAAGFSTSHEWPPDTGHDLSGRFGPVLAQRLDASR